MNNNAIATIPAIPHDRIAAVEVSHHTLAAAWSLSRVGPDAALRWRSLSGADDWNPVMNQGVSVSMSWMSAPAAAEGGGHFAVGDCHCDCGWSAPMVQRPGQSRSEFADELRNLATLHWVNWIAGSEG